MKISVTQIIPFPRKAVFAVLRDHLPELADYLPNIKKIEVKERTEEGPVVRLLNLWHAAQTEVPTIAKPFLDPSKLNWLDRSVWDENTWENHWDIEVGFMKDRVTCKGTTIYEEKSPTETEVRIQGELLIDLKGYLPKLIAKRASPKVESFVVDLIEPNFAKTNEGVIRFLEAHPDFS